MLKMIYYVLVLGLGLLFVGIVVFVQDVMIMFIGVFNLVLCDVVLKLVFDDFGGKVGLVSLMDDFMVNLFVDVCICLYFENVDQVYIKVELVDQFCVILDGLCIYIGKDMVQVYCNFGIDCVVFYVLVEDLQLVMNKYNILFCLQNKFFVKFVLMYCEVVMK